MNRIRIFQKYIHNFVLSLSIIEKQGLPQFKIRSVGRGWKRILNEAIVCIIMGAFAIVVIAGFWNGIFYIFSAFFD